MHATTKIPVNKAMYAFNSFHEVVHAVVESESLMDFVDICCPPAAEESIDFVVSRDGVGAITQGAAERSVPCGELDEYEISGGVWLG